MGVPGKDRKLQNQVVSNPILTEQELEQLYKVGLIRRYVDSIPETMLRHRPTLRIASEEDQKDTVAKFDTFLKQTNFYQALREVVQLQRIYGGAGLVLLIDDGQEPQEPVNTQRIRAIRGYVPLSRHELIPDEVTFTDYSKPEYYRVTTNQRVEPGQQAQYTNLLVHNTRVARFDGLYLPWNLRARNTGWGQSVIEVIYDAWQDYSSTLHGLNSLVGEGDLLVHQIPGLMQRIASGGESDIRKRLELNNMARSIYGSMVLDKEESITNISRNLTNISSATEPFIRHLQAATGWPASILMGESPGGLGKEGRFEERVWASLIEQWQESYCRTPVTEIFTYIALSKEGPMKGKPPEDWEVDFPSVFTQTDKEKAELRESVSRSDNTYVQLGVLDAAELRQSRFGDTEFSIETTLLESISERLSLQSDLQFQQQVGGLEAQMQAAQGGGMEGEMPPGPEGQDMEEQPPEGEGEQPAEGEGVPQEVPPAFPDAKKKTATSFDSMDAQGLKIRITHTAGECKAGYLVGPDGQRIDASDSAPLMVFGPHRTKAYKLYRARFTSDSELIDGPYVTGFASLRAAKLGLSSLYPRQTVAGLSAVPQAEIESLRAGWDAY